MIMIGKAFGNYGKLLETPAYKRRFPGLVVLEKPGHGKDVVASLISAEDILKDPNTPRDEYWEAIAPPGREGKDRVPTDYSRQIIKEGLTF
jgi:hypothetical protein